MPMCGCVYADVSGCVYVDVCVWGCLCGGVMFTNEGKGIGFLGWSDMVQNRTAYVRLALMMYELIYFR